jgi:pimeloyl-ACP methyl ester carboxylesterase
MPISASTTAFPQWAIAEAPPRFVLIGFSLGGYVAREITRLAPDRVRALILVATSSRADTPQQSQRKATAAKLVGNPFKGLSSSSIEQSLHPARASDRDMVARIRVMGVRLGGDAFQRQSSLTRDSDFDRLGEIRCPTLIVAGAEDRARSLAESDELRQDIPGSTLEIVHDSGRMIPMEQPIVLAETIKSWLHNAVDMP